MRYRWMHQHIDGLMQKRCNSIANTMELHLSCTNPSTYIIPITHSPEQTTHQSHETIDIQVIHIHGIAIQLYCTEILLSGPITFRESTKNPTNIHWIVVQYVILFRFWIHLNTSWNYIIHDKLPLIIEVCIHKFCQQITLSKADKKWVTCHRITW